MYNIDLLENEKIESMDDESQLLVDGKAVDVVTILTNKRLIILKDVNSEIDYKETLKFTKAVSYLPEYESLLSVELTKIKNIELAEDGFYKCILSDTNYFVIRSTTILEKCSNVRSQIL